MTDRYRDWALIASCPEHGLHGDRAECFECGRDADQVLMLRLEGHEEVGLLIDGVAHLVDSTHREAAPLLSRLQATYADLRDVTHG